MNNVQKKADLFYMRNLAGLLVHPKVAHQEFVAVYVVDGCPVSSHAASLHEIIVASQSEPMVRPFCYDPEGEHFISLETLRQTGELPDSLQHCLIGVGFQPYHANRVIGMLEKQGYSLTRHYLKAK
ncbi:hypothetical protein HYU11_06340 [Candidatus Woesearchaeota archaeon]|nr:hypothetical protein [Candidatus Woesearchaeota archaeon]